MMVVRDGLMNGVDVGVGVGLVVGEAMVIV